MHYILMVLLFGISNACVAKETLSGATTPRHEFTNYDFEKLITLRDRMQNGKLHPLLFQKMLRDADAMLQAPLLSVMQKTVVPPSGNKHDYVSLAPYWWPDPDQPDGLPWLRKDGEVNPATKDSNTDDQAKDRTFYLIKNLALAAWISGKEEYGKRAVEHLNHWFLDPTTKMNPNLNFAQGIPGVNDGRCFGIIEFTGIQGIVDALELLDHNGMLPTATKSGMHAWLTEVVGWLQTSPLGMEEGSRTNNHATWYDVQVVCLLRYLGRADEARSVLSAAKTKIIASQIEPDGRQPHELQRTKSISYSIMNLRGLTRLAWHGRQLGVDLWNYQTPDGRGIRKAYAFLQPFAFGDKSWEYQQLGGQAKHLESLRGLFYQTGALMEVAGYCKLRDREQRPPKDIEALLTICH